MSPRTERKFAGKKGSNLSKGGVTIGAVEIVLRAGVTKTEALNDLDLPFYATLGANFRF